MSETKIIAHYLDEDDLEVGVEQHELGWPVLKITTADGGRGLDSLTVIVTEGDGRFTYSFDLDAYDGREVRNAEGEWEEVPLKSPEERAAALTRFLEERQVEQ